MEVIWCINHDATAIRSHSENYPMCKHSTEDIRTFDMTELVKLVKKLRRREPNCKIAIWASLECTNFSNAKNGPKVADSRTLALDMYRYLVLIKPDFFWVENVTEFMDWGPLKENGHPDKTQLGADYNKWVSTIRKEFPFYAKDVLVSADYGGVTIRKRLFLQFSKCKELIGVPQQTHSKDGEFYPKWRAVKEVLDLSDIGKSIFNRERPYVPTTHRRIYTGLLKFGPSGGTNFGIKYYGQLGHQDVREPSATLTTKDRISLVHVFVHNPQYGGSTKSVHDPSPTLIARQDKAPLGITSALQGSPVFKKNPNDDMFMDLIKDYCLKHNISDILMRPLSVDEMLRIQGFPDWYSLTGTKTEQKKHIGNSVEVKVGIALFQAIDKQIQKAA